MARTEALTHMENRLWPAIWHQRTKYSHVTIHTYADTSTDAVIIVVMNHSTKISYTMSLISRYEIENGEWGKFGVRALEAAQKADGSSKPHSSLQELTDLNNIQNFLDKE